MLEISAIPPVSMARRRLVGDLFSNLPRSGAIFMRLEEDFHHAPWIRFYTAAADSDGTLGGLVELGKPEHHGRLLRQAI